MTICLVDSHCHLNFPEYEGRLEETILEAAQHGVQYCLTVNTSLNETEALIDITKKFKNVFSSVGAHPNDVIEHQELIDHTESSKTTLYKKLVSYGLLPQIVGLGETGLDYYYEHSPRKLQQDSLRIHAQASCDSNLPLIIHTRNADDDIIKILQEFPGVQGVFHCFSGDHELAKQALALGFYISFSGIITFKNADELRTIATHIPLDRILVETDSPYLAPVPYRGKKNQPAFTRHVAECLAQTRNESIDIIAAATTENFFRLFRKALSLV